MEKRAKMGKENKLKKGSLVKICLNDDKDPTISFFEQVVIVCDEDDIAFTFYPALKDCSYRLSKRIFQKHRRSLFGYRWAELIISTRKN